MIESGTGNLLEADVEAVVNTVNTVGVMGKGIALQFKNAYPENFKAYAAACKRGEVVPGRMFVHDSGRMGSGRYVINFPTKRHWKSRSRLADIEAGLVDLVRVIRELEIRSIAVPPLGCGNGGLDWDDVSPLIHGALEPLTDVRVLVFSPDGAPVPDAMPVRTKRPHLTGPRAATIAVLDRYLVSDYRLSALEVQKLSYFLQVVGAPMKLNYVKGQFGPYADNLNHALQGLEGHYLRGYGDRSSEMALYVLPGAAEEAFDYLNAEGALVDSVAAVASLVRGFETPYGLELLSTVHWAAQDVGSDELEPVLSYVQAWTTRKGEIFTKQHVAKALEHLKRHDLLAA